LTGIAKVDAGGGNDTVYSATSISGHVVYDGNAGTDRLVITLMLDQAQDATLRDQFAILAANNGNGIVDAAGLDFQSQNFEGLEVRVQVGDAYLPIDAGNVWIGTPNHDDRLPGQPGYTEALSVPDYRSDQINESWAILVATVMIGSLAATRTISLSARAATTR